MSALLKIFIGDFQKTPAFGVSILTKNYLIALQHRWMSGKIP